MGHSPWGHKESDRTERLTLLLLLIDLKILNEEKSPHSPAHTQCLYLAPA